MVAAAHLLEEAADNSDLHSDCPAKGKWLAGNMGKLVWFLRKCGLGCWKTSTDEERRECLLALTFSGIDTPRYVKAVCSNGGRVGFSVRDLG